MRDERAANRVVAALPDAFPDTDRCPHCTKALSLLSRTTKKIRLRRSRILIIQTKPAASARCLAAAGDADLFPQGVDADRADHDLLADHVARSAVHAHGFGELEVFLERAAHFGARQILL